MVVLFHLGAAGFDSGFLGVDVFFVISGYLMALLYDPKKKWEYFRKRARRLLPAYFVVVLTTVIVAAGVAVPSDYEQVATQSIFATIFASNVGFWAENSYFDKAAFRPLLHLWSLAVEIQFYLLVPVICWFARAVRFGFPLLIVGSAITCFLVVDVSPKTSFFWTPLRLWEFLIGFGVASPIYKIRTTSTFAWVGFFALITIVCIAFIQIDGQSLGFMHGHPGLIALFVAGATGVTISLGIPKRVEDNLVSSVLEKIGDYSYSIYLAHFPVIVLLLYQPFSGTNVKASNIGQTLALATLVVVASVLLYVLVELPGRRLSNASLLCSCVACVVLVLGVAQFVPLVHRAIIPQNEMRIYEAWDDRAVYRCGKIARIIHPKALSCEITEPLEKPSHRILLVGNSHADSIKVAFASVAQAKNASVYFIVENTPLMDKASLTPELVIREAMTRNADSIVLHYSPSAVQMLTIERLATLAKANGIRLDFIMPVPVWDTHIPTALIHHVKDGTALPAQTINDYRHANSELSLGLSRIDGLNVYQTADVFCKNDCVVISADGHPLYFDGGHLTLSGGDMLRGVFDGLITNLQ